MEFTKQTSSATAAKIKRRIDVIYRRIADLKPDPRNARQHNRKQIRQIADSIQTFDFNVPILIDKDDCVVAGHGRLLACQLLGHTEVPTICLEHLTPAQLKAFMLTDNRLAQNATWDDQLLAEQLKELSLLDLDFSLEITGFDTGEIDFRIECLNDTQSNAGKDDVADAIPLQSFIPVTQVGDIWQLGEHRIHCGNAIDEAAYIRLMGERLAEMVFADPPFNVAIDGHVSGHGQIKHREFAMACGEMNETEFTQFLTNAFVLMARYSKPGAIHCQCMDWRHIKEIITAGENAYTELKNLCVWTKDNAGMGSLYRSQHELIFVFKSGSEPHINNIQLGKYGRNRTNVWKYPGANSFARSRNEEGNPFALHPTVKPTALVADAILDCSNRGDLILDTFLGSGTTVIAAERTGRVGYGMELDPLYVDTAIRRWQNLTGQSALHAGTGQTFQERESEAARIHAAQPVRNSGSEVSHEV